MRMRSWGLVVAGWSALACGGLAEKAEEQAIELIIQQDLPKTPPDGGLDLEVADDATTLPESFPLTLPPEVWGAQMVLATGRATMVSLSVDLPLEEAVAGLTQALVEVGCEAPVRTDADRRVTLQCVGTPGWATLSANVVGREGELSAQVSYAPASEQAVVPPTP